MRLKLKDNLFTIPTQQVTFLPNTPIVYTVRENQDYSIVFLNHNIFNM